MGFSFYDCRIVILYFIDSKLCEALAPAATMLMQSCAVIYLSQKNSNQNGEFWGTMMTICLSDLGRDKNLSLCCRDTGSCVAEFMCSAC